MRISELAASAGVPTTTVRYYERIGLLGPADRTAAGYRDYDAEAATRLLFVARARRMGLSCEQIADLLPVWGGADCTAAHDRVGRLLAERQGEVAARIAELEEFAAQLAEARAVLDATPPLDCCDDDLTCCVPATGPQIVALTVRDAVRA